MFEQQIFPPKSLFFFTSVKFSYFLFALSSSLIYISQTSAATSPIYSSSDASSIFGSSIYSFCLGPLYSSWQSSKTSMGSNLSKTDLLMYLVLLFQKLIFWSGYGPRQLSKWYFLTPSRQPSASSPLRGTNLSIWLFHRYTQIRSSCLPKQMNFFTGNIQFQFFREYVMMWVPNGISFSPLNLLPICQLILSIPNSICSGESKSRSTPVVANLSRKSYGSMIYLQQYKRAFNVSHVMCRLQQNYQLMQGRSINDLYSMQSSNSIGGIEGYFVEKKYYDPNKIRQQRIISQSKDKFKGPKPVNVSKKTTFIDDVQKISAKLPGPCSYEPSIKEKSKTNDSIKFPDRKTVFDEITHLEKKKHVPGAGTYGKIETQADKARQKSNLSKAETPTYLEASMRNSLDCPGVGQYNSSRPYFDQRGNRWVNDPELKKKKSVEKLPPVGTYNPKSISFHLFSNNTDGSKKKSISGMGGKSERFQSPKDKKLPFYDILSEWGMKNKLQKKDILTKISTNSSKSVYY